MLGYYHLFCAYAYKNYFRYGTRWSKYVHSNIKYAGEPLEICTYFRIVLSVAATTKNIQLLYRVLCKPFILYLC